jgi:hypothetical protein
MAEGPNEFMLLRLAVQNLACAPQAQRRYVQLGMLDRAIGNLKRLGAQVETFVSAGTIRPDQAEAIRDVLSELIQQMEADEHFLPHDGFEAREYLFGSDLETEGWDKVRQIARRCHTAILGEQSAFLAINAK